MKNFANPDLLERDYKVLNDVLIHLANFWINKETKVAHLWTKHKTFVWNTEVIHNVLNFIVNQGNPLLSEIEDLPEATHFS